MREPCVEPGGRRRMKRPRACNGGQRAAQGGGREGQGRNAAKNGKETQREPTHTGQHARSNNRAQLREPRRENGVEADETEKSAAPAA